ncbi:hypothetical protein L3C95_32905 [Chitinophaga filiformis]|uniref:hypothetical protein n=1 Tax=Chitinophaga filiformis TaxID=104663 RepID=UPI001F3E6FAF|nr:hypothetical protein [Chitinophaga filiformis]MCF6407734.1 hypothetical protein [Chitinophaga filiformis]
MKKIFIISYFSLFFFSCRSKHDFRYTEDKNAYSQVRDCLLTNYSLFFSSTNREQYITFGADDLERKVLCKGAAKLFNDHSIEYVAFERDSTVIFFSQVEQGIASKQFFLMFVRDDKLRKKLTSDVEIVAKRDVGCYELVRIISLAN